MFNKFFSIRQCKKLGFLNIPKFSTFTPRLTDEQLTVKETVRRLCEEKLSKNVIAIDHHDKFDQEFWRELGELGLLGVTVKEEYGGSNLGYFEHCLITEEISRVSPSIALSYGAHSNLCVNQISLNGTHEQKSKYLPKLSSGEFVGALAMSETEAGSDVTSMNATAVTNNDGASYVLNGSKYWITNGTEADVFVIYAKTLNKEKNQMKITSFLVEKGTPGFSVVPIKNKMGMRGSMTAELVFENCEITSQQIMGELHKGVYVLMKGLDYERLVLSAIPIGIMQGSIDCSFKYAHERKTFGSVIGKHQMIQAKMADMYTKCCASRAYLYDVARSADEQKTKSMDCASVLLFASENATQVALDAVQLMGGFGYMNDNLPSMFLRDAKLMEIGAGTTEIRRWLIGREINKLF